MIKNELFHCNHRGSKGRTWQLEDLHTFALLVLTDERHTRALDFLDESRVDFIPMTMPLPDLIRPLVQFPQLGPIARRIEHGRPQSQSHRTTHVRFGDLRHEDDDRILSVRVELSRRGVLLAADVADPFDDGKLESETNSKEWDVLFACPFDGKNHALCAAHSEPSWYENASVHA